MKKLLSLLSLVILPFIANAQTKVEIDGIYYNIVPKGKLAEVVSGEKKYTGEVIIPESVTYDGVECDVKTIGHSAFSSCTGLKSVTIPNSVTSIGGYAFAGCTGLTSVTIPNSVTTIGGYAFNDCTGLTSVNISDLAAWCNISFNSYSSNPLSYANKLYLNGMEIKDLVIPNSVTTIGENAFHGCTGLTSVTIPNSVTAIGSGAFYGCTGLSSVTIPNSVATIDGAFSGCTGLTSVTIPNSVTAIGHSAFSGCTGLKSVTIPNSVTSIGGYAFNGCTGLTSVTIPNSVKTIGEQAFDGCTGLKSVTIPNSVTEIGNRTFLGCTGLTSVTIPNSVTAIGEGAFFRCTGLTSVTIPNSVKTIGYDAFANCSNLETVYCYAENVPKVDSSSFEKSYIEYATLYVPDGSLEKYKNHSEWGKFGTILPLSGGSGGNDEKEKCEAPTISQKNGKINISCGTENAVIEYNYSIAANGGGTLGKDPLNPVARITVNAWASAEGYDTSDTTTATFDVACAGSGNKGDVNEDGTVDISDVVKVINIMAGGE